MNTSETATETSIPKAALGGEAMKLAHRHSTAQTTKGKEERDERARRINDLKAQGYSYGEIASLVGCNPSTVGYWIQKTEGRLPASIKARMAKDDLGKLVSKPPSKKPPMIVSDFQREELLEGLADSLWSRLSVVDKVRVIQHVQKDGE